MQRWIEVADAVAATRSNSAKIAAVAAYLRSLDAEALPHAVVFLSGRPFPDREARTTGLGWAALAAAAERVATEAPGTAAERVVTAEPATPPATPEVPAPDPAPISLGAAYDRSSDLGTAVGDLFTAAGHTPTGTPPTITETAAAFRAMAAARGAAGKTPILEDLFRRSTPDVARAIAKILSGELRIGLRGGHLEAAIAQAFDRPLADVQWAGMLTGDIGCTAELARDDALGTAQMTLFHPLTCMLASPAADEAEVLARMVPPVWVEDKYDGIRAQLHRQGSEVRLFSRDLNDVSGQFPEVVDAARDLPWDGILDGEILAWKDGAALPFLQLQARLGRKNPSPAILAQTPVIYVAFDAIALAPAPGQEVEPLLRHPLRDRRARLEALGLADTAGFGLAALQTAETAPELDAIFGASQARGNEGLMIKDPDSIYAPGRRGYAWLKLKRPMTTLDCVVVGVEVGHGRRHGVLSDYTFAVLDDRPAAPDGRLVTIGKAYSGLTDAEIATMTTWFTEHTLSVHGRYRVVEPTVVVEIAFDVLHRSTRHASGFAMRFPRIVRIRDDKRPDEVDRLSTVAALHDRLETAGRYTILTRER
jgi:DNA ligase-1